MPGRWMQAIAMSDSNRRSFLANCSGAILGSTLLGSMSGRVSGSDDCTGYPTTRRGDKLHFNWSESYDNNYGIDIEYYGGTGGCTPRCAYEDMTYRGDEAAKCWGTLYDDEAQDWFYSSKNGEQLHTLQVEAEDSGLFTYYVTDMKSEEYDSYAPVTLKAEFPNGGIFRDLEYYVNTTESEAMKGTIDKPTGSLENSVELDTYGNVTQIQLNMTRDTVVTVARAPRNSVY